MSVERAFAIVDRVPLGACLRLEAKRCGGARLKTCSVCRTSQGHGPYWVARWRSGPNRWRSAFIGSEQKVAEVRRAWSVIEAHLAEAAALVKETPEQKRLRELCQRAGVKRARGDAPDEGIATIPILGARPK